MDELVFRNFNDATKSAIPTVLAYDPKTKTFVIGSAAKTLAMSGRPVVQDFKRRIGDTDALFCAGSA